MCLLLRVKMRHFAVGTAGSLQVTSVQVGNGATQTGENDRNLLWEYLRDN